MNVVPAEFRGGQVGAWRAYALEAHGSQMYGKRPYSDHLDEGARLLRHLGYPALVVAGFFLHDVPEDTAKQVEDIEQELNPPLIVISGLRAVTSFRGEQ